MCTANRTFVQFWPDVKSRWLRIERRKMESALYWRFIKKMFSDLFCVCLVHLVRVLSHSCSTKDAPKLLRNHAAHILIHGRNIRFISGQRLRSFLLWCWWFLSNLSRLWTHCYRDKTHDFNVPRVCRTRSGRPRVRPRALRRCDRERARRACEEKARVWRLLTPHPVDSASGRPQPRLWRSWADRRPRSLSTSILVTLISR